MAEAQVPDRLLVMVMTNLIRASNALSQPSRLGQAVPDGCQGREIVEQFPCVSERFIVHEVALRRRGWSWHAPDRLPPLQHA